jgi:hypothetical protein
MSRPTTCYINRIFCLINFPAVTLPICFSLLSLFTIGLVFLSDNDLTPMSLLLTTPSLAKIFLELVYNTDYCLIAKYSVVK